jgi:hypothetical protein
MLVFVVGIETLIGYQGAQFTGNGAWSWRISGREAQRRGPRAEVLCFGDSLLKHGLVPEVVERRFGRRAYNLAACAGQAPTSYFLLRRALRSGARPEIVLVDYKSDLMMGGPEYNTRQWQEMLNLGECLELAWNAANPHLLATVLLGRALPSYRARFEIRGRLLAAIHKEHYVLKYDAILHERNWEANQGAEVVPNAPAFNGQLDPALEARYHLDKVWCNRLNRLYIDRFLKLASARGIKVFWLIPPATQVIESKRKGYGADLRYTRLVREFQERHPGLAVIDGRGSGFADAYFWDPVHLNRPGSLAFTAALAEVLSRGRSGQLEGVRWVELPRIEEKALAFPVEDLNDSRLALKLPESTLRR